jgi:hypothetical protein
MRAASPDRPVVSAVDGPDRAQIDTVAPELQHDCASDTVADRRDPVRVSPRFGAQHAKGSVADAPHPVGVREQGGHARQHLLGIGEPAPAVEIEGQRHVSSSARASARPRWKSFRPGPSGPTRTADRRSTPAGSARWPIIISPSAGYSTVRVVIVVMRLESSVLEPASRWSSARAGALAASESRQGRGAAHRSRGSRGSLGQQRPRCA